MQKAFVQYLRSLSQGGISVVPKGSKALSDQLKKAREATREANAQEAEWVTPQTPRDDQPASMDEVRDAGSPANATLGGSEQRTGPLEASGDFDRLHLLQILDAKVQACVQCPELVANRTQTVFGVGNPQPRLCFVGEAPGADEDIQGEPFVGAAGQLLNRILEACKMKRDDVYILNTLKCRPPGNRNPATEECQNCRPFLDEQLSILRPEFICCLGGIAAKSLLNLETSVGRLRGKLHLYQGIPVMVTYHPAYLLRYPDAKRQVWDDMKFLMKEMGHSIE